MGGGREQWGLEETVFGGGVYRESAKWRMGLGLGEYETS